MMTYGVEKIESAIHHEIQERMALCETLRERAYYKTGSISEAAAVYLRLLCDQFKPATIIEIGTFIGTSTMAMESCPSVGHIYTCDKDNDCLASSTTITCFPKKTSTQMLTQLLEWKVTAEVFFFDGRIQGVDLAAILRLSAPFAIYAFDDYEGHEKGVVNVEMLKPYLKDYTLIRPPASVGALESKTSIALLMPKELV
jgi:O-methyltransferase